MKLYLVRHAIAEARTSDYEDDSLRPLTEKGREKMKKISVALKQLGVQPDLIVSSPYIRASQTASILAKALKYKEEIVYNDSLTPMSNPDDMIGEINEKFSVDELMLVGHEPNLSTLASVLLAGNPDVSINFKKGGICCLSVDDLHYDRKAVLEWLITPKISIKVS
ncbi:MAG TPA: phosphohistidine phosphatase SixA [Anaerolineales bacterium]|nr:phosphohistidine phosphatase SixA [Anaerolineales bacterium]